MDDLPVELLAEVELLLRQRIGLNPDSLGKNHIQDAVSIRRKTCASVSIADYLERLRFQEDEFQELVELLIVPESWFFRDLQPFRCLEHYLRGHHSGSSAILANRSDGPTETSRHQPLRVLSAPCGTGEEAYSIAMTILNAGLDPARFKVDGVDISRHALLRAADGAYGELSFREREDAVPSFREQFFHRVDQSLVVRDQVRAPVHFRQANVVAPDFLKGEARYDVIFCRNLLIYLDASARRLTLNNLRRLLKDDGLLYVGHVEGTTVPRDVFCKYGNTFPFAYQPVHAERRKREIEIGVPMSRSRKVSSAKWAQAPVTALEIPRAPAQTLPIFDDPRADFDKVRQAADRGHLAEAESQCLELLTRYPPRAQVYCLLGVVRQAQGDADEAAKCFHKALYLDPRHHEALVHAALLARQRGEEQLAQKYDKRAARTRAEG